MVKDFLQGFLALVQGRRESWAFEERRKGLVRLHCSYRCLFALEGERCSCTIVDLGQGGLGLTTCESLQPGQIVKVFCPFIELDGPCTAVEGRVCWSQLRGKQWHAGISYQGTPDSWAFAVLQLLGFTGHGLESRRRWVRAECTLPGRVGSQEVKLHNLGVGGALVETPMALEEGALPLQIGPCFRLPVLEIEGAMTHLRDATHYGFEFRQLDSAQLKLLGQYLKALLRRSM